MGQSAYVNGGTIGFNDKESAEAAFEIIEAWVNKANRGELPEDQNGDYGIDGLELNAAAMCIMFGASSGRVQNLEWQLENLLNACKPLKGIAFFEAPIMVQSDEGIFWSPEDEE